MSDLSTADAAAAATAPALVRLNGPCTCPRQVSARHDRSRAGKIAILFRRRGNSAQIIQRIVEPQSLKRNEEKRTVFCRCEAWGWTVATNQTTRVDIKFEIGTVETWMTVAAPTPATTRRVNVCHIALNTRRIDGE